MIEIRFHGRGGQGAVIASKLLAEAAFREGKEVSAFPYFGVERRGAPVTAFTRIDDRPIRIKSQIYRPDYVIVLDPSLLKSVDVSAGLKEGGLVVVNSSRPLDELKREVGVDNMVAVDATQIAIEHRLGSRNAPIVNSAILGAFAKASGLVKIGSVIDSILENAPAKKEENAGAAKDAYAAVGGE
ncbi:MAG: 2-oxoacid:acceptor oxidoreductase family protein [Thermoplasmata archaeon]|nr:2-oxoacid:acceptor oxidoreductase family protein [Thermoplasmata archaeon]